MRQHSWSMLKHLIHRKKTWKHLSHMGKIPSPKLETNAPSWHNTTILNMMTSSNAHTCLCQDGDGPLLPHLTFLEHQVNRWSWSKSHIYILQYIFWCFTHVHTDMTIHISPNYIKDARRRRCWEGFICPLQVCVRTNHDLLKWIYLARRYPQPPRFREVPAACQLTWGINSKPTCLTNWGWGPDQVGLLHDNHSSFIKWHNFRQFLSLVCEKESKMHQTHGQAGWFWLTHSSHQQPMPWDVPQKSSSVWLWFVFYWTWIYIDMFCHVLPEATKNSIHIGKKRQLSPKARIWS